MVSVCLYQGLCCGAAVRVGKVSPSQRQPLKSEVKSLREQPNEMWLLDFGMCEVCVTVLDVWKRPFGQIP